mgnify:CR=1 FL=1
MCAANAARLARELGRRVVGAAPGGGCVPLREETGRNAGTLYCLHKHPAVCTSTTHRLYNQVSFLASHHPTSSPVGCPVGEHAAGGAGKEVGESKHRGQGPRLRQADVELVVQVLRKDCDGEGRGGEGRPREGPPQKMVGAQPSSRHAGVGIRCWQRCKGGEGLGQGGRASQRRSRAEEG